MVGDYFLTLEGLLNIDFYNLELIFDMINIDIIIKVLIVVIIPIILCEVIKHFIVDFHKKVDLFSDENISSIVKILRIITIVVIVLSVLDVFGINITTLFVSLGFLTVGGSLITRDILSNLIAGFSIIAEKRFKVGDVIEVDKYKGTVQKIGFKSVELLSKNEVVIIPNIIFSQKAYINHTANGCFMQRMKFSLSKNDHLNDNLKIIREVIESNDNVLKDFDYKLYVRSFDNEKVDITAVLPISDVDMRKTIVSELLGEIYLKVDHSQDNDDY